MALLRNEADLAVHSLKDLPTDLPDGLELGAVGKRADVRDVLIYRAAPKPGAPAPLRGFAPALRVADLPPGAVVATSSTRRQAQLRCLQPALHLVEIRGNVLTRLQKIAGRAEFDATLLALAGMTRLGYHIREDGRLTGEGVPEGLLAVVLPENDMLPCVGQAAVGLEVRRADARIAAICRRLNHTETLACVTAERAFLAAMGGGCQSPVAAWAVVVGGRLQMRAVSFASGPMRRTEADRPVDQPRELGQAVAAILKG